jgi:hypothetical protein
VAERGDGAERRDRRRVGRGRGVTVSDTRDRGAQRRAGAGVELARSRCDADVGLRVGHAPGDIPHTAADALGECEHKRDQFPYAVGAILDVAVALAERKPDDGHRERLGVTVAVHGSVAGWARSSPPP